MYFTSPAKTSLTNPGWTQNSSGDILAELAVSASSSFRSITAFIRLCITCTESEVLSSMRFCTSSNKNWRSRSWTQLGT